MHVIDATFLLLFVKVVYYWILVWVYLSCECWLSKCWPIALSIIVESSECWILHRACEVIAWWHTIDRELIKKRWIWGNMLLLLLMHHHLLLCYWLCLLLDLDLGRGLRSIYQVSLRLNVLMLRSKSEVPLCPPTYWGWMTWGRRLPIEWHLLPTWLRNLMLVLLLSFLFLHLS